MDKNIIIGFSLPDNGGFEKQMDYEELSKVRKDLEDKFNEEISAINSRYNIHTYIEHSKEDFYKITVRFNVDLTTFIP